LIEYENLRKANEPFVGQFRQRFEAVLRSGWFILGEEVQAFEREFAQYCGVSHCVGLGNGLEALHLSLRAVGLPAGSEVLVPSNTYIATILAVVQAGLLPVPVEPDIRTYNIDPKRIEERITRRTAAVMIVHLYGKMCDMDPIVRICRANGLKLIEDCAQAHGAAYKGRRAGTFGDLGAFSFYPTKNLGCLGDGGAVVTESEELAARVRTLRNYGSKAKYHNEVLGYNSRLDELQAAFLRVKLRHLEEINAHKRSLADEYRAGLSSGYVLPIKEEGFFDVYHIFNVRHRQRDRLRAFLLDRGVKTEVHYPVSPNRQPAMKGIMDEACPISEEIHATTVSLPISFFHTPQDAARVCELLNEFEEIGES
jgi:dTDP-4-amino-4,6-dideoxygalactose transaminase